MNPKYLLFTLMMAFSMIACAQDSGAKDELMSALDTLEQAPTYSFSYSIMPSTEATSPVTGEGSADMEANAWRYTIQSDPSDPNADRSKDGEWIVTDGTWYHNTGGGWTTGDIDFTSTGISFLIGAFTEYDTFEMFAGLSEDPDTLQEITLVGREMIDGIQADHYQFAIKDMPAFGTGTYDAWVSREGDALTRVILAVTMSDGSANRVTFSQIGEPVSIEAPQ